MSDCSPDTYLVAARELLVAVGQRHPHMPSEQRALVQEAIEHVDRVQDARGRDR
ncbi:hypothetical protein [Halorubrum sp. Hd13]|uniref:hypothetical protein n=1 Tax=Halorubrum sp. Hd13 TaxID=1480728 RepID=UPI00148241BF|nr:hypothetical protein [Halorubrum sp. Hd13]